MDITEKFSKLLKFWQEAASDLGLQLMVPFNLTLASGHKLEAIFLIQKFGTAKGMLIFGQYDEIAPYVDEIVDAGYGFSVLDEPMENEKFNKEEYIELLADWGWYGGVDFQPDWL